MNNALLKTTFIVFIICHSFIADAQDNPYSDYQVKNKLSSKVMDVPANSTQLGLRIWVYNMNFSRAQRFRFFKETDGLYYIENENGLYLTVDVPPLTTQLGSGHAADPAVYFIKQDIRYPVSSIPVLNPRGPNPAAQKWKLTYQNDALTYTIESKLMKGFVIEPAGNGSGSYLRLTRKNGSLIQNWIINALG